MLTMNQAAVFHLHKIERAIAPLVNRRFKLSNVNDINDLLVIADASQNDAIKESLAAFMANCDIQSLQDHPLLKSA